MSHTPNELVEFFSADSLRRAEADNPHFSKLSEEYHALNREIHRGETDVEPMDDMRLEDLRKKRLALLDEMRSILAVRDG
ncbi:MAG: YdcH family protein [Rhodobacteraceae bacterium]|nr:YdcH family protein [Paracoccaceae bacterium]